MGFHKTARLLYQQDKLPPLKLQSARRLEPEMHLGAPGVSPTHSPLTREGSLLISNFSFSMAAIIIAIFKNELIRG
jgi:hypothetical protein